MLKWTEVNVYSGRPVEEDAPTNSAGAGHVDGIGVGPKGEPGIRPKKKKRLLDARTKEYKQHAEKLKMRREKRMSSKLGESIAAKTDDFNREMYMVEDNMTMLRDIVKKKAMKPIKFKDGQMKVDLFTASAITQVFDKVNSSNQAKIKNMVNGSKKDFMKISQAVMKLAK